MKRRMVFLGLLVFAVSLVAAAVALSAGSVGSVGCSPEPSKKGNTVTCSASYTAVNPVSCTVEFGDGTIVAGTLAPSGKNAGSCSADNVYTHKGYYDVSVSVSDKKGHSFEGYGGHTVK